MLPITTPTKLQSFLTLGETDNHDYSVYDFDQADVNVLIDLACSQTSRQMDLTQPQAWAYVHALYALAQLPTPWVLQPMLQRWSELAPNMDSDNLLVGEILADTFKALDPDLCYPAVLDFLSSTNDLIDDVYSNYYLFEVIRAKEHPLWRDYIVEQCLELLQNSTSSHRMRNAYVVSLLIDCQAVEHIGAIERVYANNTIDVTFNGDFEAVEMELGLRTKRSQLAPNIYELERSLARQNAPSQANLSLEQLDHMLSRLHSSDANAIIHNSSALDGYLVAILSCPTCLPTSTWMPAIWAHAPLPWQSKEEAIEFTSAILNTYNNVNEMLMQGDFSPVVSASSHDAPAAFDSASAWAIGYLYGLSLWPALSHTDQMRLDIQKNYCTELIKAEINNQTHDKKTEWIATQQDAMFQNTLDLFAHFRFKSNTFIHEQAKVGRNDPCPCGSGKKYKKCCLH